MSSSPASTIANEATWSFWPNPPNNDFAKIIPVSPAAQRAFRALVRDTGRDAVPLQQLYAKRFLHFEETSAEHVIPDAFQHDSSTEHESGGEAGVNQGEGLPLVTGYYRLSMLDPHPKDHPTRWTLGAGRREKNVELVFAAEGARDSHLRGRHASIQRSWDNGHLFLVAIERTIRVDGVELSRSGGGPGGRTQCTLTHGSQISIGDLSYAVEMVDLSPRVAEQQFAAAKKRFTHLPLSLPPFLLTPTPSHTVAQQGDYLISGVIAKGSYGGVYFATHRFSAQTCAIKIMTVSGRAQEDDIRNEAAILRRLNHPHVLQLMDFIDGNIMDHVRSETVLVRQFSLVFSKPARRVLSEFVLDNWFKQDSDTHTQFVRDVLEQLSSACKWLHEREIMHRDIKLSNVGVRSEPPGAVDVVLLDFGHAIHAKTSNDHMKGTLAYLAPEMADLKNGTSSAPYTNAVDVWALGVLTLELIQLDHMKHRHNHVHALQRASGLTKTPMNDLIRHMLSRSPNDRPSMPVIYDSIQETSKGDKRGRSAVD